MIETTCLLCKARMQLFVSHSSIYSMKVYFFWHLILWVQAFLLFLFSFYLYDYKDNDFGSIGISIFVLVHVYVLLLPFLTHASNSTFNWANFSPYYLLCFFFLLSFHSFLLSSCFRCMRDWYIYFSICHCKMVLSRSQIEKEKKKQNK